MRPAVFRGEPDRPDQEAGERAERDRPPPADAQADELDAERLGDVQREVRCGLTQDRADHQRQEAAERDEERDAGERAAAPEPHARGHQRDAGGEREQHRLPDQAELRNAEVELALEGRHADEQRAREAQVAEALERCLRDR